MALLVAMCAARPAIAQESYRARYRRVEEPKALKVRLTELEAGLYVEDLREETSYTDSDISTTYKRSFIGPTLGVGAGGSVYHPNFMTFDLSAQAAYGWANKETDSGTTVSTEEFQEYGSFRGNIDLFRRKPLNARLFGSYGRTYREYDFFTHSTVKTLEYGSQVAYRNPSAYLGALYSRREDETVDVDSPYSSVQDLLSLDAQQYRPRGSSTANYTINNYLYSNTGPDIEVLNHTVSLSDAERFGSRERMNLLASVSVSRRDSDEDPSDQLTAISSLTVEHRPELDSFYDASYDRFEADDFTSDTLLASARLHHQLYESLASTVEIRGADSETKSADSSGYTRRYGVAWAEGYTKRLGRPHRLRLDQSLSYDRVDQQGAGQALNERHTFPVPPAIESFDLGLSDVDVASIVVTDENGLRTYARGIDYEVFPSGSRTEIRRIPGGSIPEGGTVLVDYDADPSARGSYGSIVEACGFRLELWDNHWGLYGRLNLTRNDAAADVRALEKTDYTLGTDSTWQRFRVGAEYERYDSEDTSYESTRFFESFYFDPDDLSGLSIDLSQTFTRHLDTDRDEEDYRYIARYNRRMTSRLWVTMRAGFDDRRGEGVDQTLFVLRPTLDYRIGLTRIEAAYDYEDNEYLNREKRQKNLFTMTLKRRF